MDKKNIFNFNLLPEKIFLLGFGAVGKCFADMLFMYFPTASLYICDYIFPENFEENFKFYNVIKIQKELTLENFEEVFAVLKDGDMIVDLSTYINFYKIWHFCQIKKLLYINTALQEWRHEETEEANSFPRNEQDAYMSTIWSRKIKLLEDPLWNSEGPTCVLEHGMNPGLISHFVKRGLEEAAQHFLTKKNEYFELNFEDIEKFLRERNYSKLAQSLKLFSIHCSEIDNQQMEKTPEDVKQKLYNTWSCHGFIAEALVPIEIHYGSHEDKVSDKYPRIDNRMIMSWSPSRFHYAKSWCPPDHNFKGILIPHGESSSINNFLTDMETGYKPTQQYVYDINPYAKIWINNQDPKLSLENCDPPTEVIHPMNYKIWGFDKIGAFLLFEKNRGWWIGSIMDNTDSAKFFGGKYGPTVLQVAAGVFSAFIWICKNKSRGCNWPESLDTHEILDISKEYLGNFYSNYVDLTETHVKDCYKFEDFLVNQEKY